MRSRNFRIGLAVTLLAGIAAFACSRVAGHYRTEGEWLLARGTAEADEYTSTFDLGVAERELKTFEHRRAVLQNAHSWYRGQLTFILVAALSAMASYFLYLLAKLQSQIVEADEPNTEVTVIDPHQLFRR